LGLLTLHHIQKVSPAEWPTTAAAQVMIPAAQVKTARPDTELWAALEEMDRDGVNQLPVMANGRMSGILGPEDVLSFLRTLRALAYNRFDTRGGTH